MQPKRAAAAVTYSILLSPIVPHCPARVREVYQCISASASAAEVPCQSEVRGTTEAEADKVETRHYGTIAQIALALVERFAPSVPLPSQQPQPTSFVASALSTLLSPTHPPSAPTPHFAQLAYPTQALG